jgi:hypothetical protein
MKFAAFLFASAVVLTPAGAQIQIPSASPSSVAAKPAAGTMGVERSPLPVATLTTVEKDLNARLATVGGADPAVVLGRGTRGLYVTGVGAVFAVDVDLINTPSIGLFQTSISPEQKAQIHKRKLVHLATMQAAMRDMVIALAQSPALKSLAPSDQIVLGVRVMCAPWEDTSGIPGQIVVRADRQGGNIKMELQ